MNAANITSEIFIERQRQIAGEGHGVDHDDMHDRGELAAAAAAYALQAACTVATGTGQTSTFEPLTPADLWPWAPVEFNTKNPRADLIRAGALIVAEIERLDRAQSRQPH